MAEPEDIYKYFEDLDFRDELFAKLREISGVDVYYVYTGNHYFITVGSSRRGTKYDSYELKLQPGPADYFWKGKPDYNCSIYSVYLAYGLCFPNVEPMAPRQWDRNRQLLSQMLYHFCFAHWFGDCIVQVKRECPTWDVRAPNRKIALQEFHNVVSDWIQFWL